jgi:SAM-dependent methyltransferase
MNQTKLAFCAEPAGRRYRLRLARYQGLAEALAQFVVSSPAGRGPKVALLDVGVGNGRTLRYCEALGVADQIEFHGVDNSLRRLSWVYGGSRWRLTQADVQDGLPFPDDRFDAVVCEQLLEHVPNPEAVAAELARVLAPGGLLVVGVPVYRPVFAYLRKTVVPRLDRWLGIRRDHVQVFTLKSIRRLLEQTGNLAVGDARGFRLFSGGPFRVLEDYHWWYQFNRFLGRRLPSWCIEVQILATKLHPTAH